jgi:hypothetical protein
LEGGDSSDAGPARTTLAQPNDRCRFAAPHTTTRAFRLSPRRSESPRSTESYTIVHRRSMIGHYDWTPARSTRAMMANRLFNLSVESRSIELELTSRRRPLGKCASQLTRAAEAGPPWRALKTKPPRASRGARSHMPPTYVRMYRHVRTKALRHLEITRQTRGGRSDRDRATYAAEAAAAAAAPPCDDAAVGVRLKSVNCAAW